MKHAFEKLTDAELLQRYMEGDEAAFREIVSRYKNGLYAFLKQFLNQPDLVDDVFQETFLQLFASRKSFDLSRPLRPWLFTIAANKARDALRNLSRKKAAALDAQIGGGDEDATYVDLLQADIELPIEKLQNQELRQTVQETVMEMPEHLREVLILSYFHQMPYKDIAEALDVPLGTVKSRLHAAVGHFARRWESVGKRFREKDQ